jgi:hypothetical protein
MNPSELWEHAIEQTKRLEEHEGPYHVRFGEYKGKMHRDKIPCYGIDWVLDIYVGKETVRISIWDVLTKQGSWATTPSDTAIMKLRLVL